MKGQRHRDRPLIIIYDFIYLFCCKNHYTKDRQITNPAFPSCPKDKNTLVIMSLPSGLNHFSFLLLNLFGWYKSSTFGLVFRNWLWMRKPFFDLVSLAAGSNNWIWWFILYTIPNYVVWLLFHCVTGRSVIFVGRTDPKKFLSIGNSNQFTFKIHWPVRPFRLCLCGRRIKGMSECSVREPSTKGQRKEVGSDTRFYVLFLKI